MTQQDPAVFTSSAIALQNVTIDLPNGLNSAYTLNAGSTAPTYATANQVFHDTANNWLLLRDSTNANWLPKFPTDDVGVIRYVAGVPTGAVTSKYEHEIVLDAANNNLYRANSSNTNSDWQVLTSKLPQNYYDVRFTYLAARTAKVLANSQVRSSDNTTDIPVSADLTLDLDTSGANGLDTGAIAANTWYYPYLIYNLTTATSAVIASLVNESDTGNITLPSGFTKKRQLQTAVYTNSSSNLLDFDYFPGEKKTLFRNFDYNGSPYNFLHTVAHVPNKTGVATFSPSNCKRIVLFAYHSFANTPGQGSTIALLYHANSSSSQIYLGFVTAQNSDQNSNTSMFDILLDDSNQIGYAKGPNSRLTLSTMGFYMDGVI